MWLIDNHFPDGYRILCYNCNLSLGHYGYCPHQTKKSIYEINNHEKLKQKNIDGTRNKLHRRIYRMKTKLKIIEEYGNKCELCNESKPEFLTIDHIDGFVQEHIEYGKKLSGDDLYLYLKRNNYPKKHYRLLCYNCNCSIGHNQIIK